MINNKKNDYFSGFTLMELMVSIIVMSFAYLGIMTLYMEVIRNHTQDQIVEQVRFSLSGQMDRIVYDIKGADSINYENANQTTLIKILSISDEGEWVETVEYKHDPDKGILINGEQKNFYSNSINHLFEEDGVYELEVVEFDLCKDCPGSDHGTEDDVKDNMYELTAEFELTSKNNENFNKALKFKNEFFALGQYSRTGVGDEDE